MEPIESTETSAYINTLTPGTYPKDKKLQSKHGESLKSRIIILYVLGLGLSYRMLSGDPILSILLGGLHPFFHRVDTVVPVMVSGCFPFCLCAAAIFVGSFLSHLLHRPEFVPKVNNALLIPSC